MATKKILKDILRVYQIFTFIKDLGEYIEMHT